MNSNLYYKMRFSILVILYGMVMLSCNEQPKNCKFRTDDMIVKLGAIDDSLEHNSSYSKQIIEKRMTEAIDSMDYYELYLRLCRYYVTSTHPDSAFTGLTNCIYYLERQAPSPRINSMLSYVYNCKAEYYHVFHRNEDLVVKLRYKSYMFSMKGCDKEFSPSACANLADSYAFSNDMPHAAFWYRRALFLVDSLKLPAINNVSLYLGLGQIYMFLSNDEMAADCYKKSERYFDEMRPATQVFFLNNYGNYYYYQRNYQEALKKFTQLKILLDRYNMQNSYSMYLCKINLADICLNLNRIYESKTYLSEVEPFFVGNKDDTGIYYCNTIKIGQALKENKLSSISNILATERIRIIIDPGLTSIRERYLQQYYIKTNDFRRAFYKLKNYVAYNDSMEKSHRYMNASEIMMRFSADTLALHHKIAMQKKDEEVRRDETTVIISVSAIIILILVLSLGLIYSRKKSLQTKYDIMKLRLDNIRNRISPHFVFNVLNNKIATAEKNESDELLAITKLIRVNLDISSKPFITLNDELNFIKYYIDVQKALLGNDLHYSANVQSDINTRDIVIPSMFIQILVENSIKHGFVEKQGEKNIIVSVDKSIDSIVISVTDNGNGFDIRRSNFGSTKTGLNVIRNTINIINQTKKQKITFDINNLTDSEGKVIGCKSTITILL